MDSLHDLEEDPAIEVVVQKDVADFVLELQKMGLAQHGLEDTLVGKTAVVGIEVLGKVSYNVFGKARITNVVVDLEYRTFEVLVEVVQLEEDNHNHLLGSRVVVVGRNFHDDMVGSVSWKHRGDSRSLDKT